MERLERFLGAPQTEAGGDRRERKTVAPQCEDVLVSVTTRS